MGNTYNHLEEYIRQLLNNISIFHPHQLNIETVSSRLGLTVHYIPHDAMYVDGNIFLDIRQSDSKQWEDFGHELCHARWHAGDQALISVMMREFQEWKADNFAQNLCIPSFMLNNINLPAYERDAVWMIMEKFAVERKFAEKRLEQYIRNWMAQ
ncbi:ImmA/IrrE family metallo-endopeptidase [Planomicrobium sp. CPCC 101079]|uniref:ImmA/IrrE family metallo-endopeptidase n=1 Tax=Planomicrobium sp. CPCC 101079 TaxID=2599618 RepID=UPI0011B8497C|nr:ImmA/IrrE family metallo-endopeptidase [Planomicrobium sp. CPCC 101079]TWT04640.1 ImmA/IrrE family metallo-endopeptidase [Planomicrobium sp. CPCC 101079]